MNSCWNIVLSPAHAEDGVSIVVPLERLNTLDAGALQWLVPGLLRDKLLAMIRSLPKPLRRALTPVPSFADALQQSLAKQRSTSLLKACATELKRMTGLDLAESDFDETSLEPHLRMRISVVDEQGQELASGRDLLALQQKLGREAQREFMDRQGQGINRDGAASWEFGELELKAKTAEGADAWPALVDQQDAVGLRLFDTFEDAWLSHQAGVLRLLRLQLSDKVGWLLKHPGLNRECQLAWAPQSPVESLVNDLVESSLAQAAGDVWAIRSAAAFDTLCTEVRSKSGGVCRRQADVLNEVIPRGGQLLARLARISKSKSLDRLAEPAEETLLDIRHQLADMIYPGFLAELEPGHLQHFPRYFEAIEERLVQAAENPQRDLQRLQEVEPFQRMYDQRLESGADYDEALDQFRWMLAEFRVSVFAQRLGTVGKVSAKRLQQAWKQVIA